MLASITPLGEWGRRRRWGVTVGWYVAGSALGGAALGAAAGGIGALLPLPGGVPLGLLAAAVCALGLAYDLGPAGLALPTPHRQVDEDWLTRYRGWVVGLGFGVQLGFGVVTIVTTAGVYVTTALALLSGSPAAGLAVGTSFGVVRALPVLALRTVTTPVRLGDLHRRLVALDPAARHLTLGVHAAAALALLMAAGGLLR